MLGFLKTKTSPAALGVGLADWTDATKEDGQFLRGLPAAVDHARVRLELRYLRAFAVVFVVFHQLGETPVADALFSAYYRVISLKIDLGAGLTMSDIEDRLGEYRQALTEGGNLGAHYGVGKAFARLCGTDDIVVVTAGTIEFSATCIALADLFKKIRVAPQ